MIGGANDISKKVKEFFKVNEALIPIFVKSGTASSGVNSEDIYLFISEDVQGIKFSVCGNTVLFPLGIMEDEDDIFILTLMSIMKEKPYQPTLNKGLSKLLQISLKTNVFFIYVTWKARNDFLYNSRIVQELVIL